jgi:hypothetical protein
MNDLREFTRVVLMGIAAYFVLEAGMGLIKAIPYLFLRGMPWSVYWVGGALTVVLTIIFAGAILYVGIYRMNDIVEWVVGGEDAVPFTGCWLRVSLRLVCLAAGLFFLVWGCGRIAGVISTVALIFQSGADYARSLALSQAVAGTVQLGLGLYLLSGAPGFVRWQVRKTIEQCKQLEQGGK